MSNVLPIVEAKLFLLPKLGMGWGKTYEEFKKVIDELKEYERDYSKISIVHKMPNGRKVQRYMNMTQLQIKELNDKKDKERTPGFYSVIYQKKPTVGYFGIMPFGGSFGWNLAFLRVTCPSLCLDEIDENEIFGVMEKQESNVTDNKA